MSKTINLLIECSFQNFIYQSKWSFLNNVLLINFVSLQTFVLHKSVSTKIHNPQVFIPCCIFALLIGIYTSSQLSRQTFRGKIFYVLTFGTYGVMMTIAMFQHCLFDLNFNRIFHTIARFFNSSLTTSIAVGYFWCGLSDIGYDPNHWSFKMVFPFLFNNSYLFHL